jgi:hypothetical protein
LTELVLTAYDVQKYLQEALPALRAAIYRGDLSQAKDVLSLYDDTLYDEYDLSQELIEGDFSWVFTEHAADPDSMDPEGLLVGLTYPLILVYHHPELFRVVLGGSELQGALPFLKHPTPPQPSGNPALAVQPGFREGLRAMWEIVGFITPEGTKALQCYCAAASQENAPARPAAVSRLLAQLAEGLKAVVERGFGLVVERD